MTRITVGNSEAENKSESDTLCAEREDYGGGRKGVEWSVKRVYRERKGSLRGLDWRWLTKSVDYFPSHTHTRASQRATLPAGCGAELRPFITPAGLVTLVSLTKVL